jgi:ribonuclease III
MPTRRSRHNSATNVSDSTDQLEHMLDYKFTNRALLNQALTHKSAINERHLYPNASEVDNRTLANVGDAALKYAVAQYLYRNHPSGPFNVGHLHDGAQQFIQNKVLFPIAQDLHLEKYVIRGNGHAEMSPLMYASSHQAGRCIIM